jgi:hypothetical protein
MIPGNKKMSKEKKVDEWRRLQRQSPMPKLVPKAQIGVIVPTKELITEPVLEARYR